MGCILKTGFVSKMNEYVSFIRNMFVNIRIRNRYSSLNNRIKVSMHIYFKTKYPRNCITYLLKIKIKLF